MTEHRPSRLKLALALPATLGLAACAKNAMNTAPAAPPSAAAATATEAREPAPADLKGQVEALRRAEAELNQVLGGGAAAQAARPSSDDHTPKKAPAELKDEGARKEDQIRRSGDACGTACAALASMERATGHLCDLAGEADQRCEDARTRVRSATDRVRSSCPSCSAP